MFERNRVSENIESPEEKKDKVMSRIKDRLSVGSSIDGADVAKIMEVWDHLDDEIKEDLPRAFPELAAALLADKLGVERRWGGGKRRQ